MKFLGVTDEKTTCELCGKSNLKRTVAIEIEGGIVYYGCDCAAKVLAKSIKGVTARDTNLYADVMTYAQKWLAVYDLPVVANGIWNKYGLLVDVRGGAIYVKVAGGDIVITK